jgi:fluoride ion exporter CrcB/FEX
MLEIRQILLVALGGAVGSVLRYKLGGLCCITRPVRIFHLAHFAST